MSVKPYLKKYLPWVITFGALYITFKDLDWSLLLSHVGDANPLYVLGAFVLTIFSYFFRSRRWQDLFPECKMDYPNATAVLVLGFFFNNVLPARAGEFVRAHLGAQVSGQSRALVLATVASERLIDGLTISLFFVLFSFGVGEAGLARNLSYVAIGFAAIALGVLVIIALRSHLQTLTEKILEKRQSEKLEWFTNKAHQFLEGLSPLSSWNRLPLLLLWSAVIWGTELGVFYLVTKAYGADLSIAFTVFMMVAMNFSSLIPAAPGGIGVIEAVGTAALVSLGVPKELALVMVLTQHVIQYIVVGVPGAFLTVTWKKRLEKLRAEELSESAALV
jgi:uncharacterized protein (TIRG00374 family)